MIHGTDADADGDGWSDEEENLCGSLLNDSPVPLDTDSDGMCDAMDDDIDGDTWPNTSELVCVTDPYNPLSMPSADTDSDGYAMIFIWMMTEMA